MAGVTLVLLGGVLPGLSVYVGSLLLTVGTAICLVGPLFVAQKLLTRRLEATANAVAENTQAVTAVGVTADQALETAKSVGDAVAGVQAQLRSRLADRRAEDETQRQRAAGGSQKDFVDLFERAERAGWIAERGLRMYTGMSGLWLRAKLSGAGQAPRSVEFAFEGPTFDQIGESVVWPPAERAESAESDRAAALDLLEQLFNTLRQADMSPGGDPFSEHDLIADMTRDVSAIIDLHDGPNPSKQVGPVAEVLPGNWAITTEGLQGWEPDVYISATDLSGDLDKALERIDPNPDDADRKLFLSLLAYAREAQRKLGSERAEKDRELARKHLTERAELLARVFR